MEISGDCWELTRSSRQYFSVRSESLSYFFDAANVHQRSKFAASNCTFLGTFIRKVPRRMRRISSFTFAAIQAYRWKNLFKILKWVFDTYNLTDEHTSILYSRSTSLSICGDAGISHLQSRIHTSVFQPQIRQIHLCTSPPGKMCHAVVVVPDLSDHCFSGF